MEAPGRVELPTNGLGNRCSIHLSYGASKAEIRRQLTEFIIAWAFLTSSAVATLWGAPIVATPLRCRPEPLVAGHQAAMSCESSPKPE